MNEIDLVIKIPEEIYKNIQSENFWLDSGLTLSNAYDFIKNGVPLSKGHKRLIEDNFEVGPVFDEEGHRIGYKYVTQEDLNNAQTIIPADEESEI